MPLKHVWGIDIGSSSIRAVKLVRSPEGVKLADYDIRELSYRGREEDKILEAIRKALIGLAGRKSLIGEKVVVSIAGASCFQRIVKIPPCPLSKVPELMKFEAQQQIPFKLNEVIWDYQMISAPDDVSEGRRIVLFALKRTVIEPILGFCREAMMRVVGVQLTHIALYNYLKWELNLDKPISILDMGARYTEFALFDTGFSNDLWVRPLPISGMHLTEIVAERQRLSFIEAEQTKISSLVVGGEVQGQIKPALTNIVGELQRSLGFFKSQTGNRDVTKIFLTGRALAFEGSITFLQSQINIPIAEVSYPQKIAYSLIGSAELFFDDCRQLGVAFGLGLQGLDETHFSTNLLPASRQLDNVLSDKKVPVFVALLLIWTALLVAYIFVGMRTVQVNAHIKDMKTAIKQIEADDNAFDKVLYQIPPKILAMENLASFAKGRAVPFNVFNNLTASINAVRAEGYKIWVLSVDYDDITKTKLDEWAVSLNLPTVYGVANVIAWKAGSGTISPEEKKIFSQLEPSRQPKWYSFVIGGEAEAGEGAEKLKNVERLRAEIAKNSELFSDVVIATDWKEVDLSTDVSKPFIAIYFSIKATVKIAPYIVDKEPEEPEMLPEDIQ